MDVGLNEAQISRPEAHEASSLMAVCPPLSQNLFSWPCFSCIVSLMLKKPIRMKNHHSVHSLTKLLRISIRCQTSKSVSMIKRETFKARLSS